MYVVHIVHVVHLVHMQTYYVACSTDRSTQPVDIVHIQLTHAHPHTNMHIQVKGSLTVGRTSVTNTGLAH